MAHTEFNRLSVFLVDTVEIGDPIPSRPVFRTVERDAVDGDRHFAEGRAHS